MRLSSFCVGLVWERCEGWIGCGFRGKGRWREDKDGDGANVCLVFCRPKEEIPGDMGFVAYFTDSEKNVMGLWSAK